MSQKALKIFFKLGVIHLDYTRIHSYVIYTFLFIFVRHQTIKRHPKFAQKSQIRSECFEQFVLFFSIALSVVCNNYKNLSREITKLDTQ